MIGERCWINEGKDRTTVVSAGIDWGAALVLVARDGPVLLTKRAGHKTWGGLGQDQRYEPAAFIVLHLEGRVHEDRYDDHEWWYFHQEFQIEVGHGKAGLEHAMARMHGVAHGERECIRKTAERRAHEARVAEEAAEAERKAIKIETVTHDRIEVLRVAEQVALRISDDTFLLTSDDGELKIATTSGRRLLLAIADDAVVLTTGD